MKIYKVSWVRINEGLDNQGSDNRGSDNQGSDNQGSDNQGLHCINNFVTDGEHNYLWSDNTELWWSMDVANNYK